MNEEWEPADFVNAAGKRVVKVVEEDGWPTVGVVDFDKAVLSADGPDDPLRMHAQRQPGDEQSRTQGLGGWCGMKGLIVTVS